MYKNLSILFIATVFLACKGDNAKVKELSLVAQSQTPNWNYSPMENSGFSNSAAVLTKEA